MNEVEPRSFSGNRRVVVVVIFFCELHVIIVFMKQKDALDILKMGHNAYITGQAGSGKTHVLNEYITYLKNRDVAVGVTASTGIASTHIGGVTIHSWSGVGIKNQLTESDIDAMQQKQYLWKRMEKAKVLIIDEVSMLSPNMLDMVERVCRAFKRNDAPFGGLQVVLSGDFFQLPPISRGGGKIMFANESNAWEKMDIRVCYLEEQYRQNDDVLSGILNEIRSGGVSEDTMNVLRSRYNKTINGVETPTRLYTHNLDVDALNNKELEKISGDSVAFDMESSGRGNLVDTLKKSVLAPVELKLKKGAVVMFVKNNFEAGYVNGTLGKVVDFDSFDMPIIETTLGKKIHVDNVSWTIEEDGKVLAQVRQLPLRLAWAITIHKSQGMSMDGAEMDLSKSFVPGQGYVALSRLRNILGLKLMGLNDVALSVNAGVAVFDKELLEKSKQHQKQIQGVSNSEKKEFHTDFILKCEGTIDSEKIAENATMIVSSPQNRESTYEKTKQLIEEGLSMEAIAERRSVTIGTILSHLEKIKIEDNKIVLDRFKPEKKIFNEIKKTFTEFEDNKLTPVYKKLDGKYSYEDLRLVRLFLD